MLNIITVTSQYAAETRLWKSRVEAAGGGFEWNSLFLANSLVQALKSKRYYTKIKYMLPLLGKGINAARVPLIDTLNVGTATNSGFTDSAFSQSSGIQGNGTHYFGTLVQPSRLGTTNNAGFGWWVRSLSGNGWTLACRSADLSEIYGGFASTSDELFYYGPAGSDTRTNVSAGNNHYYAQRISATDRKLYRNAVQIASTSGSHAASGANTNTLRFMALDDSNITSNRIGVAYLTSGDLTVDEIRDFHLTLQRYLIGPTGR